MKQHLFLLFTIAFLYSCKKDTFITAADANLGLSADTLRFDTVFTSSGSITQFLKIYNSNDEKLRISALELAGGNASSFRINADGIPGPLVQQIEIGPNDSTYIFITVTIDPSASQLPFIIRDSLSIRYNGNIRWVQLEAWGQNAHFFRSRIIKTNEVWNDSLPYVITGGLVVDTNAILTIEAGTRVFFHADAPLLIEGSLRVMGEQYDSTKVIFSSDRLDEPYRDFPGAWPGIYFRPASKDNILTHAIIRNAYQGIVAEQLSVNANPRLTLNACIVDNCYDAGLLAIGSSIVAVNCLFSNNGKNMMLIKGGSYDFTHCTSAAYSNAFILHKDPVLFLTDYIKNGNVITTADLVANFTNCIFWGDNGTVENEIVTGRQGTGLFDVMLNNCLWKAKDDIPNTTRVNPFVNQDPLFDSIHVQKRTFDFHLKAGSPAINKGVVTPITTDLDGKSRTAGLPDLGSYEKN